MDASFQTLAALGAVAAAAAWLGARALSRRNRPGCGGDCGCDSGGIRARAVRRAKPR